MQFQVPQFIDIAPKIVGPLTLIQFLFLAGAAVPSFLLFFVLKFWLWLLITVILASLAVALAFVKFNGQSLLKVAMAALSYFWQPRFYLWRRLEAQKGPSLPLAPRLTGRALLEGLMLKLSTSRSPIEKRERPARLFTKGIEGFETVRRTTGERETARRVDYR